LRLKLKGSEEYAARIKKLEAELASKEQQWKATLAGKDDEIRKLNQMIHKLNQDLSAAQDELETANNQHQIQLKTLELSHKKALQKLKDDLENQKFQVKNLEKELNDLKAQHQNALNGLNARIKDQDKEI
jgi:chromosome segregation ATPase